MIDPSEFNQKYQLLINEYYITLSNILFKEINLYFKEVDINGLLHPKRNILNLLILMIWFDSKILIKILQKLSIKLSKIDDMLKSILIQKS